MSNINREVMEELVPRDGVDRVIHNKYGVTPIDRTLWGKARRVEVFYYMGDGKVVSEVVKDNQNER